MCQTAFRGNGGEIFKRQQTLFAVHQIQMTFNKSFIFKFTALLTFSLFFIGCGVKDKTQSAKLLKVETAAQSYLLSEVNRLAGINSMRARVDLKFEDNSYAEVGLAEKYRTADGEIVVQRPGEILLKVQVPIIGKDIAQMTSNGDKFRVAILEDGAGGKYRKFVIGTNNADYSALQGQIKKDDLTGKEMSNVNAFSNLRPQHFTEAVLVRPVDQANFTYVTSTVTEDEAEIAATATKKLVRVLRGYYLLDEYAKNADGNLKISRRFWFDRVGGIRLARQEIFDEKGEIESQITYGAQGNLGSAGEYKSFPLEISVTRPQERYKMRITYQSPTSVSIGKTYPEKAFVLENSWGLQEVDLDKKLAEAQNRKSTDEPAKMTTKFQ